MARIPSPPAHCKFTKTIFSGFFFFSVCLCHSNFPKTISPLSVQVDEDNLQPAFLYLQLRASTRRQVPATSRKYLQLRASMPIFFVTATPRRQSSKPPAGARIYRPFAERSRNRYSTAPSFHLHYSDAWTFPRIHIPSHSFTAAFTLTAAFTFTGRAKAT